MGYDMVTMPIDDRPFGIEFEFTRHCTQEALEEAVLNAVPGAAVRKAHWEHTPTDNSDWVVKFDGSCGWEICTPRSEGRVELANCSRVLDTCRAVGARVNSRCGVHVHYDMGGVNSDGIGRVLANWIKVEGVLYMALPRHRRGNPFCVKLSQVPGIRPGHNYGAGELVDMCAGNRRRALNIEPWRRDQRRIEVRVLEGLLDGRDLEMWVKFFMYFIHLSLAGPMPEGLNWRDIDETMYWLRWANDPNGGTCWECDGEMAELREWFLRKIVKNCNNRCRKAHHKARAKRYLAAFRDGSVGV